MSSRIISTCFVVQLVVGCCLFSAGCPTPPQSTCPTGHVTCECAELENRDPVEAVKTRIKVVQDLSDPSLRGPIAAATDLERLCRDSTGLFLPPRPERDASWRQKCSSAELALPALLRALDAMEAKRGPNHENREQENSLATGIVSALGNIQLGNPESVCRQSVVAALIKALETPDSVQDFRVNSAAVRMLGAIGDDRSIPVLVRAMFMKSGRSRRVFLLEPARTALLQANDLEAVAAALVRAGQLEDEGLNRMLEQSADLDPLLIKEQVARTLGEIGIASPMVTGYLMGELNHTGPDAVDRAPRGRQVSSAPLRRGYAAQALARLRHGRALGVILPRLELGEDGSSVDSSVEIAEIPAYLDAIGDFLQPEQTDQTLLTWMARGDEALGDRAGQRLYYQATTQTADRLAEHASRLAECGPDGSCLRSRIEGVYIPGMRGTAGCTTVACLSQRMSSSGTDENVRIRVAYQLAMLAHGDQAASDQARTALLTTLDSDSEELINAAAWAIDRLSPDGCDDECLQRLDDYIESHRGEATLSATTRTAISLRSRLRYRAAQ